MVLVFHSCRFPTNARSYISSKVFTFDSFFSCLIPILCIDLSSAKLLRKKCLWFIWSTCFRHLDLRFSHSLFQILLDWFKDHIFMNDTIQRSHLFGSVGSTCVDLIYVSIYLLLTSLDIFCFVAFLKNQKLFFTPLDLTFTSSSMY